jgi:hypothetical protein
VLPVVPASVPQIITLPGMPVTAVGSVGGRNNPGHRDSCDEVGARPRPADLIDSLAAALPAAAADGNT